MFLSIYLEIKKYVGKTFFFWKNCFSYLFIITVGNLHGARLRRYMFLSLYTRPLRSLTENCIGSFTIDYESHAFLQLLLSTYIHTYVFPFEYIFCYVFFCFVYLPTFPLFFSLSLFTLNARYNYQVYSFCCIRYVKMTKHIRRWWIWRPRARIWSRYSMIRILWSMYFFTLLVLSV